MQTAPLMSTKKCHQSANYWGGGIDPNKIIGGHMPPCPLKFTPMIIRFSEFSLEVTLVTFYKNFSKIHLDDKL